VSSTNDPVVLFSPPRYSSKHTMRKAYVRIDGKEKNNESNTSRRDLSEDILVIDKISL
jgi:hypothetical protein